MRQLQAGLIACQNSTGDPRRFWRAGLRQLLGVFSAGRSLNRVTRMSWSGHHDRMTDGSFRTLADALVNAATRGDQAETAPVVEQLGGLNGAGWLRLDELVRRIYWTQSPLDAVADWAPRLTAGGVLAGLAASMCRNGWVRERAGRARAARRAPGLATAVIAGSRGRYQLRRAEPGPGGRHRPIARHLRSQPTAAPGDLLRGRHPGTFGALRGGARIASGPSGGAGAGRGRRGVLRGRRAWRRRPR